jgi:hypothetical protein
MTVSALIKLKSQDTSGERKIAIHESKIVYSYWASEPRGLKLSGAWWKERNAESMLALRIIRENNEWDGYWENLKAA